MMIPMLRNQNKMSIDSNQIVIKDINQVIELLKDEWILQCEIKGNKHFAKMIKEYILVLTDNARYSLTIEQFKELYADVGFLVYEPKADAGIDFSRDDEYYSWKHK